MLTIHLAPTPKVHLSNDKFFNSFTCFKLDAEPMNSEVRKLVQEIEGAPFSGPRTIKSKFVKNADFLITTASTGAKTLMNVYFYPDEIFSLQECGDNAVAAILKLSHGHVYSKLAPYTTDRHILFETPFNLALADNTVIECENLSELRDYYNE